ncbi:hypothetical protein TSUD_373080 [Trifolium subterraneum]|uniref:Uncharacterized protein n=1 Tax=Trifolium subterraneum TaxID=3900 RepID=A0A2Z6NM76_TRISU|nr:hypothetical protein TSUD_373080 [Trifolium subterraneum]
MTINFDVNRDEFEVQLHVNHEAQTIAAQLKGRSLEKGLITHPNTMFGLRERGRKESQGRERWWKVNLSTIWTNLKKGRKEKNWWVPPNPFRATLDGKREDGPKFWRKRLYYPSFSSNFIILHYNHLNQNP